MLRTFLAGLAIASAICAVLVWTSDRWRVDRRRPRPGIGGVLAEVLAAPVLAAALLLVVALAVTLAFSFFGARLWK